MGLTDKEYQELLIQLWGEGERQPEDVPLKHKFYALVVAILLQVVGLAII